jgi:DNA-binding transcriptional ArsR family regulator
MDEEARPAAAGPGEPRRSLADRLADHDREAGLPPFRQVDDPKALRALAHPTRVALLEQLTLSGGTLTATQASELVDESPTNCAFHLRTLAKYGYVEQAEGGKGRERPWRLAHLGMGFDDDEDGEGGDGEGGDGAKGPAAGALRRMISQYHFDRIRAFDAARHTLPAAVREMAGGWDTFWYVTPEEMKELHERIGELVMLYRDRFDPARRPAGSVPVQAVIYLTPLTGPGSGTENA